MKLKLLILCCILQSIASAKLSNVKIGHPPLTPRIIGGRDAADGQMPFQCSLQKNSRHYCGCAIISPKWIITAAHCLSPKPSEIDIVVGTNQWNSGGTHYKANKTIKHEQYDSPPFAYDLGLIRVDGAIEFNEKVQPIKYSPDEVPSGASVQASGWGLLSAGGILPTNLQVINLTAISYEDCRIRSRGAHKSHLCTKSPVGEGVCNGDSGGPLVYGNELVGLANFAVPCGRGHPDGFASVSFMYEWIQKNTESK